MKISALLAFTTLNDATQKEKILIAQASKAGIFMAPYYRWFYAKKMPDLLTLATLSNATQIEKILF